MRCDPFGILTDDLAALVAHMQAKGFPCRSPVRDFGDLKYIMLERPDRVLIEVFEKKAPAPGDTGPGSSGG